MKKTLLILLCLPMIGFGQNYRLDSITGDNGLLIYSIYDNYGNAIIDYYNISTIEQKYENSYDLNNIKTETIIFEKISGSWQEYIRYIYTYDSNNNLIMMKWDDWGSGGSWNPLYKYIYSYTNNDLTLSENFSLVNGQWDTTQKSEYNYTNGNQTLVLTFNWDGASWNPIQKNERVFLNNNISTETYSTYSAAAGWTESSTADFQCNNNLINNTIYGLTLTEFSQFSTQVTETVYSFGLTYNYHYSDYTIPNSIEDISFTKGRLFKIVDILGREAKGTNQPLLYLYDDGTVEKRIVIE